MSWIGDKAEATANVLKDLLTQTPAAKLYRQGLPNVLDALLNTREEEWRAKVQAMPKPFESSPEAVNRDMEAAMAFWNPAGAVGMTVFEKAHKIAQKNATKMLGLPKNNTAADRAKALGFDRDVLHGTNRTVSEFDPGMAGAKTGNPNAGLGVFTTPNAQEASRYAEAWGRDGGNVMPLMVRSGNSYQMPYKEFDDLAMAPYRAMMADPHYNPHGVVKFGDMAGQKAAAERVRGYEQAAREEVARHRARLLADGYDTAIVSKGKPTEEVIALKPSALRSRFAAFDPARVDEPNLLAAYFGVPLYGNGDQR